MVRSGITQGVGDGPGTRIQDMKLHLETGVLSVWASLLNVTAAINTGRAEAAGKRGLGVLKRLGSEVRLLRPFRGLGPGA